MTTVKEASKEQDKGLQLINWLRAQQEDLAMAAASHLKPSTIVRVAQGALRKDPKLMAAAIANPQSLIHCLLDAARLGHEAGTDQYWLIPFGQEVTGIEGYKGIIERMYRAGGVSSVHAEIVRQRDAYRSMGSRTPPVHEYDEFADPEERGALRGVYAYAVMSDGSFSQVMRMGRAEVMKHRAMSRGSDRSDSPWQKWEEPMWKKVPLSGLEPYVPTSSEWLMARAQAAATATRAVAAPGWTPPVQAAAAPLQLVAAEVIEPEPEQPAAPAEQPARPARARKTPDSSPAPAGPPAAPADSPQQGAGEDPPARPAAMAQPGQVGAIVKRFEQLGYTDSDDDRVSRLSDTAKLAGYDGDLRTTKDLTAVQAARVARALMPLRTAQDLMELLQNGTVPGE